MSNRHEELIARARAIQAQGIIDNSGNVTQGPTLAGAVMNEGIEHRAGAEGSLAFGDPVGQMPVFTIGHSVEIAQYKEGAGVTVKVNCPHGEDVVNAAERALKLFQACRPVVREVKGWGR